MEGIYSESLLESPVELEVSSKASPQPPQGSPKYEPHLRPTVSDQLFLLKGHVEYLPKSSIYHEVLTAIERAYSQGDVSGALSRLDLLENLFDNSRVL